MAFTVKKASVKDVAKIESSLKVANVNDSYAGVKKAIDVVKKDCTMELLPFKGEAQSFETDGDNGEKITKFWIPTYWKVGKDVCGLNLATLHRNSNLDKITKTGLLSEFGACLIANPGLKLKVETCSVESSTSNPDWKYLKIKFKGEEAE